MGTENGCAARVCFAKMDRYRPRLPYVYPLCGWCCKLITRALTVRWNPTNENRIFFVQSAALYCSYYQLQILIHRPFIISYNNSSPVSFSSFALCMNAARSCIHVVDIAHRRAGFLPVTFFQVSLSLSTSNMSHVQRYISDCSLAPSIHGGRSTIAEYIRLETRWPVYRHRK